MPVGKDKDKPGTDKKYNKKPVKKKNEPKRK